MISADFVNNNMWYIYTVFAVAITVIFLICSKIGFSYIGSVLMSINPLTLMIIFLTAISPLVVFGIIAVFILMRFAFNIVNGKAIFS